MGYDGGFLFALFPYGLVKKGVGISQNVQYINIRWISLRMVVNCVYDSVLDEHY